MDFQAACSVSLRSVYVLLLCKLLFLWSSLSIKLFQSFLPFFFFFL